MCIYRGRPSFAFHIHTANYIIHSNSENLAGIFNSLLLALPTSKMTVSKPISLCVCVLFCVESSLCLISVFDQFESAN